MRIRELNSSPGNEGQFSAGLVLRPESRWPLQLPESTIAEVQSRPVRRLRTGPPKQASRPPLASIIVVTYNNLPFNRLCLESVLLNTAAPEFELIVVDNASTDGTVGFLDEFAALNQNVKLYLNNDNLGFAAACNQGLSRSNGQVLVILNNDTVVTDGWLEGLTERLNDQGIGLVGPVTNRCGNEAQIRVAYENYGELLEFAQARRRSHAEKSLELSALNMFCTAMRKDVFEQVGKLDERFRVGLFEDEDYCMRMRQAGYRLVCAEDIFVHHFGQASIGKLAGSGEYGQLFHDNRARFEQKWSVTWKPHEKRRYPDYRDLVARIRRSAVDRIPQGSVVLVVSKGDEDLVSLSGLRAGHFPATPDGCYAGYHPQDSADAIAELERRRAEGAQFLLIPDTMVWWLEQYPEFAAHLAETAALVEDSGACHIYRLVEPARIREGGAGRPAVANQVGVDRLNRRLLTVISVMPDEPQEAEFLLHRLFGLSGFPYNLLLLDGTGNEEIHKLLETAAKEHAHLAFARIETSNGETAMLNLGLSLAPGDVVVLRGSMPEHKDWLQSLDARAESRERIATVTVRGHEEPVPALFISRRALRGAGFLDSELFPKPEDALAYFRTRCEMLGFRNLVVDSVDLPIHTEPSRPCVLVVVHAGTGGSLFACEDLLPEISRAFRCLLLVTHVSHWSLWEINGTGSTALRNYRFSDPWQLDAPLGSEREEVIRDLCLQFRVDLASIQHLLFTGPGLIVALKQLQLSLVPTLHDFYMACPSLHLVDDQGRPCGGHCTDSAGDCLVGNTLIREPRPILKHHFVHDHRRQMANALEQCDAVTVPSKFVRNRVLELFPSITSRNVHIVEPGMHAGNREIAVPPDLRVPTRVVCLGHLSRLKGIELILRLMEIDTSSGRCFEFHFLGTVEPGFDLSRLGGIEHGAYQREDCLDLLAGIAPSFSLLTPICEETYSFTLSESWAAGIPVFASDRGALKERIERHGGGWLLDPDDPEAFYASMVAVRDSPRIWAEQAARAALIDQPQRSQSAGEMIDLFNTCLANREKSGQGRQGAIG